MKIRLMSDLHLEWVEDRPAPAWVPPELPDDADTVLVLAGDIWQELGWARPINGESWIEKMSKRFRAVFLVLGNHDYWGSTIDHIDAESRRLCADFPNVHFMQNTAVEIDDVQFVGGTLWTDFKRNDPLVVLDARRIMNDYKFIIHGGLKLDPLDLIGYNGESVAWLQHQFRNRPEHIRKQVAVTHHAPFEWSNADGYRDKDLVYAYVNTRFDDAVYLPDVWIHGHLHCKSDYVIDSVDESKNSARVLCNPAGYPGLKNQKRTGFDPELCIDV